MEKAKAAYQAKKMENETNLEKQKNASVKRKIMIMVPSLLCVIYTVIMFFQFMDHESDVDVEIGECQDWDEAITTGKWCMLVLTIIGVVGMVAAFVPVIRFPLCCGVCLGQTIHLLTLIYLTIARFGPGDAPCVDLNPNAKWMKNVVIAMWCIFCFYGCCLNAGIKDKGD